MSLLRKLNNRVLLRKNFKAYSSLLQKRYFNNSSDDKLIAVDISEGNLFEVQSCLSSAESYRKLNGGRIGILYNNFYGIKPTLYGVLKLGIVFSFNRINWRSIYYAFEAVCIFLRTKLSALSSLKFRDVLIGDLIYDTYIRRNVGFYKPQKDFTLLRYFYLAVKTVHMSESAARLMPVVLVTIDRCYINHGVLQRVFTKNDIPILLVGRRLKLIDENNSNVHMYHPELPLNQLQEANEFYAKLFSLESVDKYLEKRFAGSIKQVDVVRSFRNRVYSRTEFISELNLDPEKPIVFIFAHAISDFPHIAESPFEDYLDWLLFTLNITQEVNSVNWVLKPHPTSDIFGEEGIVSNYGENFSNVSICPQDFNTASALECCDLLVTMRGTVAIEFGCFGIGSITVGNSMYSGYGVDLNASSVEEYKRLLLDIPRLINSGVHHSDICRDLLFYLFTIPSPRCEFVFSNDFGLTTKMNEQFSNIFSSDLEAFESNVFSELRWVLSKQDALRQR